VSENRFELFVVLAGFLTQLFEANRNSLSTTLLGTRRIRECRGCPKDLSYKALPPHLVTLLNTRRKHRGDTIANESEQRLGISAFGWANVLGD